MSARPAPVGHYEVLTDFETRAASVRVLELANTAAEVEPHAHAWSTQIYLAVSGRAIVTEDGKETVLEPFQCLAVTPQTVHSAKALDSRAVLVNISVPPLAPDDQFPAGHQPHRSDLQLPTSTSDIED